MKTLFIILNTLVIAAETTAADTFTLKNVGDLKSAAGKIVAVVLILSFVLGLVGLVAGLLKRQDEPGESKKLMIGGAIFALAPVVLGMFFYMFGLGGAVASASW